MKDAFTEKDSKNLTNATDREQSQAWHDARTDAARDQILNGSDNSLKNSYALEKIIREVPDNSGYSHKDAMENGVDSGK